MGLKFNVGCGKNDKGKDWVHVDAADFHHVINSDITLSNEKTESAAIIYASHIIAYFDRIEIVGVLKEWFRVLEPCGVLDISTPDWDILKTLKSPLTGPLYGRMQSAGKMIYHKTVYDYHDLYTVLRAAGFIDIKRWDFASGENDCSSSTYDGKEISLNIKCTKP